MMPPEGQNKSEERLQRYAKERRGQAGEFSLHPATRRLLQGAVTRQFGARAKAGAGGRSWFWMWRGKLAVVSMLAVVLAAGVWMFTNHQPQKPVMNLADAGARANAFFSQPSEQGLRAKSEKRFAAADFGELREESAPQPTASPRGALLTSEDRKAAPAASMKLTAPVVSQPAQLVTATAGMSAAYFSGGGSEAAAPEANRFAYGVSLAPMPNNWSFQKPVDAVRLDRPDAYSVADGEKLAQFTEAPAGGATRAPGLGGPSANSGLLAYEPAQNLKRRAPGSGVALGLLEDETKQTAEFSTLEKNKPVPALAGGLATRAQATSLDSAAAPAPTSMARAAAFSDGLGANKPVEPLATADSRSEIAAAPKADARGLRAAEGAARFYRARASDPAGAVAETRRIGGVVAAQSESSIDFSAPVLSNFVIEQTGDALRIVDADGSTYNGQMEALAEADFEIDQGADKDKLLREKIVGLKSAMDDRIQNFSFRASGSNVTLRQLVEVRGRLTPDTNGAVGGSGGGFGGRAVAPVVAAAPVARRSAGPTGRGFGGAYGFTSNQTATIEGTVRIGTTNQQRFRAVRDSR